MKKIWENHVLDDCELDPLDDKTIEKVVEKLGIKFPVTYTSKILMKRIQNKTQI